MHAFNFFIHLSSVFKLLLKPLAPAPAHALAPREQADLVRVRVRVRVS